MQDLESLAYAFGTPPAEARMRARPEDFQVDEELGFDADGEGDHALIRFWKRGLNSQAVARNLGRLAGVRAVDVGFSGLKDRNAVTSQWFSVNLAGVREPDWSDLDGEDLRILEATRHRRKLRRGVHRANRFSLRLVELTGAGEAITARLQRVAGRGVPNYFGEQRFGHGQGNLASAHALLSGQSRERDRHKRGLYLSAARAMLFNRVLSVRVDQRTWDQGLAGDVMMLAGTHSIFHADVVDDVIVSRLAEGDIDPTGPLWGRGDLPVGARARQVETMALAGCEDWCRGLEGFGLKQERRPLRVRPADMTWDVPAADVLEVSFTLPAGAYATTVLRELVRTSHCVPEVNV